MSGANTTEHDSTSSPLVMLIDDDVSILVLLERTLAHEGYRVEAYSDGATALRRMEGGALPDLIVLDLWMPTMDGWHFRVAQRGIPSLAAIPVLVLTADLSKQAEAIDADAVLHKPVAAPQFLRVVAALLSASARMRQGEHLREVERLRALDQLIAGLAHEINNPLMFIVGNLTLLSRVLQEIGESATAGSVSGMATLLERSAHSIDGMRDGSDRIAAVVHATSFLATEPQAQVIPFDLAATVDAAITLIPTARLTGVSVLRDFGRIPPVAGRPALVGQAVLGLLLNATDAVREVDRKRGEIRVTVRGDGDRVVLEVSDNGVGIPPELHRRIFEPFFTTKPPGRGQGLGLSSANAIVNRHGGTISVQSTLNRGTTFRCSFPSFRGDASANASRTDEASARPKSVPGPSARPRLRVVVIDDEPVIGNAIATMLVSDQVEVYTDAERALAALRDDDRPIDVIVCDVLMPRLDGRQFFRALARERPELAKRTLFATGLNSPAELAGLAALAGRPALQKPFTFDELRRRLDEMGAEPEAS